MKGYGASRDLFEALDLRIGPTASVDELIDEYYGQLIPLLRCEDAVARSLVRVRESGWSVAIVTNGGSRQDEKIRGTGLDRLVDTWCVSEIEGSASFADAVEIVLNNANVD